ncbi:DUF1707 domain-containing protein [Rhodococcoides yunnanense]|uniref:DUF1707 domain-containing protein n=1 Tax=Rhodococcoides yunnanense TaxID=278209 RepID=A0ABU4B8P1_9NOCA|nr:DUF1707 domain-containing protein [Rhodococcus yunnanensis]MDV6260554.1 DUF1707 domain-containing protein [Rhodococcus yunnanensis]
MPTRSAPSTRARDGDRTDACATLDRAREDGQLTDAEHAARVAAAMRAATLGDLHRLIEDLQGETDLTEMAPWKSVTVPGRRGRQLGLLTVVVPLIGAVVALTFGIRSCAVADDPRHQFGSAGYLELEGLERIVSIARDQFGTTVLDDLSVYPDYAVYTRVDPARPFLGIDSIYRDGSLEEFGSPTARAASTPTVDIGALELPVVAGVIAGAGASLNLTQVDTVYLLVRDYGSGPEVSVFANNEFGESGHLTLDLDGNFTSVRPWDPEG